jgi:tetratricopeptide (TPR) repeat protein
MITTPNVAVPGKRTVALAPGAVSTGHEKSSVAWKLMGLFVFACVAGFNGWSYWRDARPLPDRKTIDDWMRRGHYVDAERALREHLRRSPHDGEARMTLARALAGRGDVLDCARQLHEVPSWWPRKVEARYREGQSYMQIDRAKDAEAAWLEAIEDDPLHPAPADLFHDACQELLKLYAIEDRFEDAYPVMWAAYDRAAPVDHPALLAMRIRPELERVAPKQTISLLERYVAAAADDKEALRALARAEQALGRPADAARHFQQCLKGWPNNVRAWRDYLGMLLEQGDLDAFVALLAKAPKSADSDAETWMFRGVAREKAGDWEAAAAHFQKAIDLNPAVPKYYFRLAMAEERLGLRKQAATHRKRTQEMNEARRQLPGALADYFAARDSSHSSGPNRMTTCRHLAAICETLGWARAAQAWRQVAIAP